MRFTFIGAPVIDSDNTEPALPRRQPQTIGTPELQHQLDRSGGLADAHQVGVVEPESSAPADARRCSNARIADLTVG